MRHRGLGRRLLDGIGRLPHRGHPGRPVVVRVQRRDQRPDVRIGGRVGAVDRVVAVPPGAAPGREDHLLVRVIRPDRGHQAPDRVVPQDRRHPGRGGVLEPRGGAEERLVLADRAALPVVDGPAGADPARAPVRGGLGRDLALDLPPEPVAVRDRVGHPDGLARCQPRGVLLPGVPVHGRRLGLRVVPGPPEGEQVVGQPAGRGADPVRPVGVQAVTGGVARLAGDRGGHQHAELVVPQVGGVAVGVDDRVRLQHPVVVFRGDQVSGWGRRRVVPAAGRGRLGRHRQRPGLVAALRQPACAGSSAANSGCASGHRHRSGARSTRRAQTADGHHRRDPHRWHAWAGATAAPRSVVARRSTAWSRAGVPRTPRRRAARDGRRSRGSSGRLPARRTRWSVRRATGMGCPMTDESCDRSSSRAPWRVAGCGSGAWSRPGFGLP